MTNSGDATYAATSQGLLFTRTAGLSWETVAGAGMEDLYFLASARGEILAAGLNRMHLSTDGGRSWKSVAPPSQLHQLTAVAVDDLGGLWAGGREGVFHSLDDGASWQAPPGLVVNDVSNLFFDAHGQRILITNGNSGTIVYAMHLPDRKISFWDTGWNLRFVRPVGDHLLGVTAFDGVVLEPRMVDSPVSSHR
jgi:photosystem II stability/assembly factor-like uncharacterized protein